MPLTPECSKRGEPRATEQGEMSIVWLTVNVHQDADVGLSHSIEHQTGDRLSEEGVVSLGGEHTLPGALEHHTALSPPGITNA